MSVISFRQGKSRWYVCGTSPYRTVMNPLYAMPVPPERVGKVVRALVEKGKADVRVEKW